MANRDVPDAGAPRMLPASKGSNLERVGSFNQALILDSVRRAGTISRVELAEITGLVPQTVTNICRRLLREGLIVESGKSSVGPGKPRTLLRLNPRARVAVGVHLDPAVITVVLLDLDGAILARRQLTTPSVAQPERVIADIAREVALVIEEAGVRPGQALGVGVGAPGPIDLRRGLIDSPPNLPAWDQAPLRDSLALATGLPVILDKDVVAAVVAENWNDAAGRHGATALVYVGTGIGAGLMVDGEVVRGASGNAGEVGHIMVDPDGPPCPCGGRGCVAVSVAPSALVRRARTVGLELPVDADPTSAAAVAALFALAEGGDALARELVDVAARGLVRMAMVIIDLHDIDRLVFGGPFWSLFRRAVIEVALPAVRSSPAAHPIHEVQVVESHLGHDMGAVGAASLVLDRFLSPRPGDLTFAG